MNRGQIRAAAVTKLRIPSSGDGLLTSPTLNDLINESLRKISRERLWPWLLTSANLTVATTGIAALPADFVEADTLIYDSAPVAWAGLHELLMSGNRYVWADDGTNVRVEPAPSASITMTLWYYRTDPDLATDASTPLMPAGHHDLIAIETAHLAALLRHDPDQAASWSGQYERELVNMVKAAFRKRGDVKVARRRDRRQWTARWP